MRSPRTLIIGIGNRYRGDDAFGCAVAATLLEQLPRSVECIEHDGDPAGLIECWQDARQLILVDAVSSGERPGTIFRIDLARQALPAQFGSYSTHACGVSEAIELARALEKLPAEACFFGAERNQSTIGQMLSPELLEAKSIVVAEIMSLLKSREQVHA